MKKILSFEINTTPLTALGDDRSFSVQGEDQAVFSIQVKDVSGKFYNFKTQAFTTAFTSENALKNKTIQGEEFNGSIIFPASASVDTYTVYLFAEPHFETEMEEGGNSGLLTVVIEQVPNSTLTFTAKAAVATPFASMPSNVTSTGSSLSTGAVTADVDWDITAASTDVGGFGIILTRQPVDTDWYFLAQDTVNGAISSATSVVVDSLTDLCVGMHIAAVDSGSLSGEPIITAIDTDTNTLTLSSAQTFADGVTLNFEARGSDVIYRAIGADITFPSLTGEVGKFTTTLEQLTKVVRTSASGTTVNLKGTYGVSGGGIVTVTGIGFINTSANTVQSVSADSTTGSIVMQVAQTIKAGAKLYFEGSALNSTTTGTIHINKYPTADRTIYFNVNNILATGTAS